MTRTEFLASFVLSNYQVMGLEKVLVDAVKAADAIYGASV